MEQYSETCEWLFRSMLTLNSERRVQTPFSMIEWTVCSIIERKTIDDRDSLAVSDGSRRVSLCIQLGYEWIGVWKVKEVKQNDGMRILTERRTHKFERKERCDIFLTQTGVTELPTIPKNSLFVTNFRPQYENTNSPCIIPNFSHFFLASYGAEY